MAQKNKLRVLALCVFQRGPMIFVAEGYDSLKGQTFYRPIGGGVEFGEYAADTLVREIKEEINAEIKDLRCLGILENIFEYEGRPSHEVCLIFDAAFVEAYRNADDYTVEGTDGTEVGSEILFTAMWKSLAFFHKGHAPLYPDGLLELLEQQ